MLDLDKLNELAKLTVKRVIRDYPEEDKILIDIDEIIQEAVRQHRKALNELEYKYHTVTDEIREMIKIKPNATKVSFRYNGIDYHMTIEEFIKEYGSRQCGYNGEIYFEFGTFNVNNYIEAVY
jgi:hypothetical protein